MKSVLRPWIVIGVVMFVLTGTAWACPNCKESISTSVSTTPGGSGDMGASTGLPSGFNTSVYILLTGLFCVIGVVTTIVVKGVRDAAKHQMPRMKAQG